MAEVRKGYLKLFDGFTLVIDGEAERFDHVRDILEQVFRWDVEHDPNARECFDLINRDLFCYHTADLSPLTGFKHRVVIEAIPSTEDFVWEDEEEVQK